MMAVVGRADACLAEPRLQPKHWPSEAATAARWTDAAVAMEVQMATDASAATQLFALG